VAITLQEERLDGDATGRRAGEQPTKNDAGTGREPRARQRRAADITDGRPNPGQVTPVMGRHGPLDEPQGMSTCWHIVPDEHGLTLSPGHRDAH
jgi:hypothetical protein